MEDIHTSINDEITLKEFIQKLKEWIKYLRTQLFKLVIAGIVGGILGLVFAFLYPKSYISKTSFVVEEAKTGSGLMGLASLAGQFGVDLGTNAGGSLIAGDNILLYLKSESLVRKTLLKPWDSTRSYADYYLEVYGIKEDLEKKLEWKGFTIPAKENEKVATRRVDSVLNELVKDIIEEELLITRVDKKAGFIELQVTMDDEVLSKRFNEELVNTAINQYLQFKTARQKKTVDRLQDRADSIAGLLNQKTYTSASLQTALSTMDMNPMYRTTSAIKTELTTRDKTMLGSIYVEVVKNLEMAKFTLSQETPVIQVVNQPIYPLEVKKKSKILTPLVFGFVSILLVLIWIITNRFYKDLK